MFHSDFTVYERFYLKLIIKTNFYNIFLWHLRAPWHLRALLTTGVAYETFTVFIYYYLLFLSSTLLICRHQQNRCHQYLTSSVFFVFFGKDWQVPQNPCDSPSDHPANRVISLRSF